MSHHRSGDVQTLLLLQPQRGRKGLSDDCAIRAGFERSEFTQPYPVSESPLLAPGCLDGEPRLAHATDPGQRHQRTLAQGHGDLAYLVGTADEARHASGQDDDGQLRRRGRRVGGSHNRVDEGPVAFEDLLMDLA